MLAGVPQVFLRLGGCNLDCSYCDTPTARVQADTCRIYGWEGLMETIANPLDARALAERVTALWERGMHSLSLTGGEPLLQADELADLLPALRTKDIPVYLETNGTLPGELAKVISWLDWVAMDLKLPYSQGGSDYLEAQRDFLRLASSVRVFIKVVVEEATPPEELEMFLHAMAAESADIPLVLQPVSVPVRGAAAGPLTPGGMEGTPAVDGWLEGPVKGAPVQGAAARYKVGISAQRAADFLRIAAACFRDVRIIPQLHRAWGIR